MKTLYRKWLEDLGSRDSRKIANNTYLERIEPDKIGLRLHSTYVVIATPRYVRFDSGGWHTPTTADRMSYSGARVSGSGKRGWAIYPIARFRDCYCARESEKNPDSDYYRRGMTNSLVRRGSEYRREWIPCHSCHGSGKIGEIDWESEGFVYYDGIRLSADLTRVLKCQPEKPTGSLVDRLIVTRSGFSGMTRQESRASWNRQVSAMRAGDWGSAFTERDKRAGIDRLEPERIEKTPLGTAAVYSIDPRRCPFLIFTPEHYRRDGSCRCNDPRHTEMLEWGYKWDGSKWIADESEDD